MPAHASRSTPTIRHTVRALTVTRMTSVRPAPALAGTAGGEAPSGFGTPDPVPLMAPPHTVVSKEPGTASLIEGADGTIGDDQNRGRVRGGENPGHPG